MNFYIIIPAHNEADSIGLTLQSLVNQTIESKKLVIVKSTNLLENPYLLL